MLTWELTFGRAKAGKKMAEGAGRKFLLSVRFVFKIQPLINIPTTRALLS
jgi:hypothetical protein